MAGISAWCVDCFLTFLGEVMNIIELAKQVGYPIQHPEWQKATEEFAALVEAVARADERKECAELMFRLDLCGEEGKAAEAIRTRGTT